jgi:hypothetical protein
MTWYSDEIRPKFDDLAPEVQERLVNAMMKIIVPDTSDLGIDAETLKHWYANRAILAFWVRNRKLRAQS